MSILERRFREKVFFGVAPPVLLLFFLEVDRQHHSVVWRSGFVFLGIGASKTLIFVVIDVLSSSMPLKPSPRGVVCVHECFVRTRIFPLVIC